MVKHAWVVLIAFAAGCAYLPGEQEKQRVSQELGTMDKVMMVDVGCGGSLLASDELCADVVMKDGYRLRFERVGFNSLGSTAVNVVVGKASGLVPRVASCRAIGPPNFHRSSALGHHFHPTLIDVKDAVHRYREVLEEVEFWPQCPLYWEVQDKRGENFRYCTRRDGATEEPPRPANCQ